MEVFQSSLPKISAQLLPNMPIIQGKSHNDCISRYKSLFSSVKNPLKDQDFPEAILAISPQRNPEFNVGLLGGMGPLATLGMIELFSHHAPELSIVCVMATKTPDRNTALQTQGASKTVIERIFSNTSTFFKNVAPNATCGIACNTAHFFFSSFTHNPLSMIECCKNELNVLDPPQVVLLGTKSTMTSGLYDNAHPRLTIPSETVQDLCHTLIFDEIKKYGEATQMAKNIATIILNYLKEEYPKGSAIVLGCTELPLVFDQSDDYFIFIDPQVAFIKTISLQ
jgi:aspartate/glutamate racemase